MHFFVPTRLRGIFGSSNESALFDGDGAKRTDSRNAFVLFVDELLMIYDPCLFIAHLEKQGVQCGTCPAADA